LTREASALDGSAICCPGSFGNFTLLSGSFSRIERLAPVRHFLFGPFTALWRGYFGLC